MRKRYFLIGASILVVIAFSIAGYKVEKNLYERELERQFRTRIVELERQLEASRLERLVAYDSIDNLNITIESLVSRDKVETDSLNRIPGKFKSLTSKQLEDKMMEEYARQTH